MLYRLSILASEELERPVCRTGLNACKEKVGGCEGKSANQRQRLCLSCGRKLGRQTVRHQFEEFALHNFAGRSDWHQGHDDHLRWSLVLGKMLSSKIRQFRLG